MGLVSQGCERLGEREGLCATPAWDREGDRADVKRIQSGRAAQTVGSKVLTNHGRGISCSVLLTFSRLARRTARLIQGPGANIPRGDYQSFTTRICAGHRRR